MKEARALSFIAILNQRLEAFPEILFAVLYGSAAEGDQFNDLDVGVWVDRTAVPAGNDLHYSFKLEQALGASLSYPVDVRIINDAPLPFAYNVCRGRPLLLRDKEAWYHFRERTWDMWLDFEPVAMKYLQEMVDA